MRKRLWALVTVAFCFASNVAIGQSASGQGDYLTPYSEYLFGVRLQSTRVQVDVSRNVAFQFQGGLIGDNIAATLSYLLEQRFIRLYPTITRPSTKPNATVLNALKDFPPDLLTEKFSALLCSWNPHVCKVSKATPGGAWKNSVATPAQFEKLLARPAKGKVIDTCATGHPETFVLCLPIVRFSDSVVLQLQEIPSSSHVETLVVKSLQGCAKLDTPCRDLIAFANFDDPFDQKFRGKAILPTRIIQMNIGIDPAVSAEKVFKALEKKYPPTNRWVTFTVPTLQGHSQGGPFEQIAQGKAEAATPEMVLPNNEGYLRAMRYTDAVRKQAMDLHKLDDPLVVGIFDRFADPLHGAYAARPLSENPVFDVRPGARLMLDYWRPKEDSHSPHEKLLRIGVDYKDLKFPNPVVPDYDDKIDHATLIAGVIGGRPDRYPAPVGANPAAQFWIYNTWRLTADSNKNIDISIIRYLYNKNVSRPAVINVSQVYDDNRLQSRLANAVYLRGGVAGLSPVIAAAGNRRDKYRFERQYTSQQCWAFPACWSITRDQASGHAGILSVVALDGTGKDLLRCKHVRQPAFLSPNWPGCSDESADEPVTQWGSLFDVSAVGLAHGPMLHNTFSSLAGTSMATAYTTGLASLIRGKEGHGDYGPPAFVTNRIRITADADAHSKFGRINFDNALRFTNDVIYLTDSDKPLVGKIDFRSLPNFKLKSFDNSMTREEIRLGDIGRLQRMMKNEWRAILLQPNDKLDLLPTVSVEMRRDLTIRTESGPVTVSLDRLRDLIPCSKCDD